MKDDEKDNRDTDTEEMWWVSVDKDIERDYFSKKRKKRKKSELSVIEQLTNEPWDFDFPQAVRILQKLNSRHILGEKDNPRFDPIHFQAHVDFNVSSSDVKSLRYSSSDDTPSVMMIAFLGLAGIQGPLPEVFTEIIMDRIKVRDEALRDFLDIFNHRLAIFWHKFYCKLFPGLKDTSLKNTIVGELLIDISGTRYHGESEAIIPRCALFWQRSSSAIGLEFALRSYFNVDCRIYPFMGGVNTIKEIDQTQLGRQFNELGYSSVLGKRAFDQSKSFRIVLGPLTYDQFQDFLPPRLSRFKPFISANDNEDKKVNVEEGKDYDDVSAYPHLISFVEAYFDSTRNFSIELVLKKEEVPRSDLTRRFALARNVWLNPRENYPSHPNVIIL